MRASLLAMKPPILVCAQSLGPNLGATAVGEAVARGLSQAGLVQADVLELPADLAAARFADRMRAAFAVVICVDHLTDSLLAAGQPGAIATDARQAGVACHAICARSDVDAFTARIYDLQTIRTTANAGRPRSRRPGAGAGSLAAGLPQSPDG